MSYTEQQTSLQSKTTISNLHTKINDLEKEYETLECYVQELTERLRILPSEIETRFQHPDQFKWVSNIKQIKNLTIHHNRFS